MLSYVFTKPIPITELEGELRVFARLAAQDGFDTVGAMMVALLPIREGEPFEIERCGSEVPITRIIYEDRLHRPKRKKSYRAADGGER